jgi:NADPH:quinone reductase-like Zn-dependent oxidoreductase
MSSTMRALVTKEPKTASVQDIPIPQPGDGEILVKVHYVAQNPTDWKAMAGSPPGAVIGCDFAGTVHDANGSHWSKGQRVAGFVQGTAPKPPRGAFAEYTVIEASLVYEIPENISYQEAAVVPLAFATAVQAIYQRLGLPEPRTPDQQATPFIVNGGTSSVGKYAVQLGKLSGLFVIATGSKKNHDLLKSLGANATVDYKDSDWEAQVRKLSNDNLQYAFDCIAENGTIQSLAKCLSPTKGGHIVTLLPAKPAEGEIKEINSKAKVESTIVYTVFQRALPYGASFDNVGGETPEDKAYWEKWLSVLPQYLSSGRIKPNKIRELGGLEDLLVGFKEQQEGKVSAEKLVYKVVPCQSKI